MGFVIYSDETSSGWQILKWNGRYSDRSEFSRSTGYVTKQYYRVVLGLNLVVSDLKKIVNLIYNNYTEKIFMQASHREAET